MSSILHLTSPLRRRRPINSVSLPLEPPPSNSIPPSTSPPVSSTLNLELNHSVDVGQEAKIFEKKKQELVEGTGGKDGGEGEEGGREVKDVREINRTFLVPSQTETIFNVSDRMAPVRECDATDDRVWGKRSEGSRIVAKEGKKEGGLKDAERWRCAW